MKPELGKRHARFFLSDGNVVFRVRDIEPIIFAETRISLTIHCPQVENTLYCVHRFFFQQYSDEFGVQYKFGEDSDDGQVAFIYLEGVQTCDFDQLLSIFYPRCGFDYQFHGDIF